MPPLTHELAQTGTLWAKELGPVTENVAQKLFASTRDFGKPKNADLPTPLAESNRSAGREPFRRKPKTVEEMRAWLLG